MRVESLRRYPVKSMLGENVNGMFVDEGVPKETGGWRSSMS
jgi:hypothetical protein